MTSAELVNLLLGIHGSILFALLVAYYKYGDRTEVLTKSLQGTDAVLERLRRQIADELGEFLRPTLENPAMVPALTVLTPEGRTYTEAPVNPIGSEAYREAVRDFLEHMPDALADYRSLSSARDAWCFWARFVSWAILLLLIWQAIATALLTLAKVLEVNPAGWLLRWSVAPTLVGGGLCLLPLPFLLVCHDTVNRVRMRYGAP